MFIQTRHHRNYARANMIIHYKRIMWFQTKISRGMSWHYHTYNVSSGDAHDMYGCWITLRIYWGQLRTRVTWCFSALYINVIPVQCRMCPASVWHGSLRESPWVYCQYTVCPMTHTHYFAVFLFRCGYITSGFVWYIFSQFFKVASVSLGGLFHCPVDSEIILKYMYKPIANKQ